MRIGINGFGRIGRAITRIALQNSVPDIVAINDINPDRNNLAYLLKYDSTYGRLPYNVEVRDKSFVVNKDQVIAVHCKEDIEAVPWEDYEVDIVIDSSGVEKNLKKLQNLLELGIKRCIITNIPVGEFFKPIIIGVNENSITREDRLLSSSTCDANAFVPVINLINKYFGVEHGFLTTLHPWLGYQNLLDGPSLSCSDPGHIHSTYALGRSSVNTLIPKTTSAIKASCYVLPYLEGKFMCFSYRIPTMIVSSADISVKVAKKLSVEDLTEVLEKAEKLQKYKIIHNCREPLTSIDFSGSEYSSTVDHRWTMVNKDKYCKLVLWYDNEWGYSKKVVDLVNYLETLE